MITGLIPAVLTPFTPDGEINQPVLQDLIEYYIKSGFEGLYICGSTGEGLLLTDEERKLVAETTIKAVQGRIPVIVHVGAPSTKAALKLAAHAHQSGADAVASIPPFYYHYCVEEIEAYYRDLKETAKLPLFFYNIPVLVNSSLDASLAERLHQEGIIQGMKYTDSNLLNLQGIMETCNGQLNVFSGPDERLLSYLMLGVHGGIGTTYNCMPELFIALFQAWKNGDINRAGDLQRKANRVIAVMARFRMIPALKAMMRMNGFDCGEPRAPFLPLTQQETEDLRTALDQVGYFSIVSELLI